MAANHQGRRRPERGESIRGSETLRNEASAYIDDIYQQESQTMRDPCKSLGAPEANFIELATILSWIIVSTSMLGMLVAMRLAF